MSDPSLTVTERTRLRRQTDRGRHDFETVAAVLDAGLICHVGFALDGRPWVFPTAYARIGRHLYLHGAAANFALRSLAQGAEACVTVTVVDALVLSRSAFHHTMNYRSVMVFGQAEAVTDGDEKLRAMLALVDHMVAGRSRDTRSPSAEELRATLVVRIPIEEASAKVRTGGPGEEPSDLGLPHWAGQLPLRLGAEEPVPDRQVPSDDDLPTPAYVRAWPDRP